MGILAGETPVIDEVFSCTIEGEKATPCRRKRSVLSRISPVRKVL
jgi:hypothetical protein